jgi:hypothetical protein
VFKGVPSLTTPEITQGKAGIIMAVNYKSALEQQLFRMNFGKSCCSVALLIRNPGLDVQPTYKKDLGFQIVKIKIRVAQVLFLYNRV